MRIIAAVARRWTRARRRPPLRSFSVRALLDRDRDGLLVFFVGVVLFGAAAACDRAAYLPVPAAAPVVAFAAVTAVSSGARCALHGAVFGQWRGAGGTECENHFDLDAVRGAMTGCTLWVKRLAGAFHSDSGGASMRKPLDIQISITLRSQG